MLETRAKRTAPTPAPRQVRKADSLADPLAGAPARAKVGNTAERAGAALDGWTLAEAPPEITTSAPKKSPTPKKPSAMDAPIVDQHTLPHERDWAFCGLATLKQTMEQHGGSVDLSSRAAIERFKQGIYIHGQGSSGAGMARRMRDNGHEDAKFTTGGNMSRIVEMLDAGGSVPTGFVSMSGTVEQMNTSGRSERYGHLKEGSRHSKKFGNSGHWSTTVGYEGKADNPTHFYVNDTDTGTRLKMSAAEYRKNVGASKGGAGVWMIDY